MNDDEAYQQEHREEQEMKTVNMDEKGDQKELTRTVDKEIETVKTNTSMIDSIQELVLRPDIDLDRIDKYLDIQERIMNKNAEIAFNGALAEMQSKLPVIKRTNKNTYTDSKYAPYEEMMKPIKLIMGDHGFSLSFTQEVVENGRMVQGKLTHKDGHSVSAEIPLPIDSGGAKNSIQSVKSTISYGRRMLAEMMLNIITEADDDDGVKGGSDYITKEQAADIRSLMTEINTDEKSFLKWFNSASVELILSTKYKSAIQALENKRNGKNNQTGRS